MNHIFKKIFLSLFICFLIFSISYCSKKKEPEPASAPQAAPDFTLPDLNGKMVSLKDFRGKVIILDFWATWCPPCRQEIPLFVDLYSQYKEKGFEIIGIALDQEGEKVVKPFSQNYNIKYPILIGGEEVSEVYGGIRGIPTTFVIDRKGNIVKKYVGFTEKEVFEEDIKALL